MLSIVKAKAGAGPEKTVSTKPVPFAMSKTNSLMTLQSQNGVLSLINNNSVACYFEVSLYNVAGKKISETINGVALPGKSFTLNSKNTSNVSYGVLRSGDQVSTLKIVNIQ